MTNQINELNNNGMVDNCGSGSDQNNNGNTLIHDLINNKNQFTSKINRGNGSSGCGGSSSIVGGSVNNSTFINIYNKNEMKIENILEFPDEVLLTILSHLEEEDIKNIYLSNRYLSSFCFENKIWKAICKRKWSSSPIFKRKPISDWRSYYLKKKEFIELSSGNHLSWIEIFSSSGEKPSPRYQNTCTAIGDYIYFIGGQDHPENRFNTIHKFNSITQEFTRLIPTGSAPPKFARHTSCAIGSKIYSHGGFDGFSQHFGLFEYCTIENKWTSLSPTYSMDQLGELDNHRSSRYADNADDSNSNSTSYLLNNNIPTSRTNHASASIGDCFYIFGGMYKNGNDLIFLNDLYEYSTSENKWTKLIGTGDHPPPKCGHKLFSFGNKLLLFGGGQGKNWESKYNDIHIYDRSFNRWTKVKTKGNIPVCTFTVSWTMGPFLFVYGGQSVKDDLLTNSLYMLDTVNMEIEEITTNYTPFARDMGSCAMVGTTLYMFGGFSSTPLDSLFQLDFSKDLDNTLTTTTPNI